MEILLHFLVRFGMCTFLNLVLFFINKKMSSIFSIDSRNFSSHNNSATIPVFAVWIFNREHLGLKINCCPSTAFRASRSILASPWCSIFERDLCRSGLFLSIKNVVSLNRYSCVHEFRGTLASGLSQQLEWRFESWWIKFTSCEFCTRRWLSLAHVVYFVCEKGR